MRQSDPEACVDWLLEHIGRVLVVGAPLGIGKPNHLINALYNRAKTDPGIKLTLMTALSLETPSASGELEARLVEPLRDRIFGDYPDLAYMADLHTDSVPDNIVISEFFFQPGAMLGQRQAQRHYRSTNYTHVARDLLDNGANVLMQLVAPGPDDDTISLSSNPDVSLELLPTIEAKRAAGEPIALLGQINRQMPSMGRDAAIAADTFDLLLEHEDLHFRPFGPPAMAVSDAEYGIALHVSALLADGGTLQIGIGALSDAIAYCAGLRHNHNGDYREVVAALGIDTQHAALIDSHGGLVPFERGLYGCTEMLVDAYLQLFRSGVLKRRVYGYAVIQRLLDQGRIEETVSPHTLAALLEAGAIRRELTADDVAFLTDAGVFKPEVRLEAGELRGIDARHVGPDLSNPANFEAVCAACLGQALATPTVVHGGFFLGPQSFYQGLRELQPEQRAQFCMTGVNRINHLYGDEDLRRAQRRHARFINTALKATALGAVVSDGLENGQVLSGVGGQYNFVAQAHALAEARSILCVRATRTSGGEVESNIVWRYGHITIPRHLRDIVITEYGIADLRGKSDAQVVAAMIEIADSRFQENLRRQAVSAGKLASDYRVPEQARDNSPQWLRERLQPSRQRELFPAFPHGTDFTQEEIVLGRALRGIQGLPRLQLVRAAAANLGALARLPAGAVPYLRRMQLDRPQSWREWALARVVVLALAHDGSL